MIPEDHFPFGIEKLGGNLMFSKDTRNLISNFHIDHNSDNDLMNLLNAFEI